jgi:ribosomal protein S18 acetylase RimI-like enzyme
MEFRRFDPAHLPQLMAWFEDAAQVRTWGGPEFRFPFDARSFREDSKVDEISSWSLVAGDTLAAFGQCYPRIGRCHVGRVAVSPQRRGEGLGTRLIRDMSAWGIAEFGARELSLFVNKDNPAAHRLYRRLGYRELPYPDPAFMPAAHYMVAKDLSGFPK